jgi:hypothetical protein
MAERRNTEKDNGKLIESIESLVESIDRNTEILKKTVPILEVVYRSGVLDSLVVLPGAIRDLIKKIDKR